MGYRINPIGFRVGSFRGWNSFWFGSNEYATLLKDDLFVHNYFKGIKHKYKYPISTPHITRSFFQTNIKTAIYNPPTFYQKETKLKEMSNSFGIVLGHNSTLCNTIGSSKHYKGNAYYFTIRTKTAQILANYMALEFEKRNPFHEITRDIIDWVRRTKNVAGIIIKCSGRFKGEEMARSLVKKYKRVPFSSIDIRLDYGCTHANTKYGSLGIKIWLFLAKRKIHKKGITHYVTSSKHTSSSVTDLNVIISKEKSFSKKS
uniref:Small ribosomal subunit protein uS3c n=1 Tax=Tsukubamonas globosa TaxID=875863 RepID=W8VY31_9EUKA|nr:ribosomal protein S3 [Tsukubamonas globosa]BAO51952.1 ribosomal protein S3 [Tsukubamonas globosa]